MKIEAISLDLIRTDGGTQMRAALDQEVYLHYRDLWKSGVEFDPVEVFHDGSTYWLADGFHRFYGAREAKRSSLPCRIHQGTQRDAILFAAGANATHGLRRTNKDKRIAVEALLNDEEWVKWSDGKIAEQAAVSREFVTQLRDQLATVASSPAASMRADEPRLGRDGKKRRPRRPKMKPPASREPGDDPTEKRHTTTAAAVKGNGKATIAGPPYDAEAVRKQFGATIRAIDDIARKSNLSNSKEHRQIASHLSDALNVFNSFVKLCDAVHARK